MKTPRRSFFLFLYLVSCWLVAFSAVGSAATVAAPTLSPAGGTYTAPQTVTLSSTTSGATIRYTLDGSTPSETAGTVYTAPITIGGTTTVKALAYATGLADSTVATANYTIKAVAPIFSPAGGTYTAPQTVTLSSTTSGATIRYTLDGSTPSETAGTVYAAPITIGGTTTVKALAYATGLADSTVATATYTIKAVAPIFSPAGGTYTAPQTVTLSSTTSGATIRYTLDGSTPSETAGTVYTVPITISGTTTVKAIAYATGLTDSTVATATYTIKVVAPTFSPAGGTYTAPQTVTLSTTTPGASIRYTLDGSTPSETAGTVYTAPITIGGTSTVKAIAYAAGLADSTVATATYTIRVAAPTFSPAGGTYTATQTVKLSSTTSGASIRYTLDGSTPSDTAGNPYTAPITISATTTVKAIAYAAGLADSTVATATYTIKAVAPKFSPAGGTYTTPQTVTLSSATPGASINYTLDGSTPSNTAGTLYTAPITISGTTTVKAIAYATGLANSSETTATYTIKVVAPTFSPAGGTFTAPQTVTLRTTTAGASMHYTLDGSTPSNTAGTLYTVPFTINVTTTVKAVAYATGLTDSTVETATYTIKAVAPTLSPAGGTYTAPQTVALSTTTTGASINYTLDGSTPSDIAGTLYTAPITLSGTTMVKAVAYATGLTDSTVTTATYTIKAVAPTFTPAGGTYTTPQTVTLSTTTAGASIHYTLDGSAPSNTAGTLYAAPFAINRTTTVKAIAYGTGLANSAVATATYRFPGAPVIASLSPTSGQVGTAVTIAGSGFGSTQGGSTVTFNGTTTGPPTEWSNTAITVNVPGGATSGNVVVTVGGLASDGMPFAVGLVPFTATAGAMGFSRSGQTQTRLANGNILVAGGQNTSGVLSSSELYAPASQTFAPSGSMTAPRWMHSATLLNDGTVLIAGGSNSVTGSTLNTAEIYNPATGAFRLLTNTLNTARAGHTATLLNNGQVLLIGGIDPVAGIISNAELYDPPTQSFIDLGPTTAPRFRHTATLLPNGQVLIAGGETDPTPTWAYDTAEVFDPATGFTPVLVPMTSPREGHAAVLLNNGQVLIAGGDNPGAGSQATAETYNPALGIFIAVAGSMTVPRTLSTMTLLNGGTVLITGGVTDQVGSSTVLNTAEVFNPTAQTFTFAGSMTSAREFQTVSLLSDGSVLVAGGTNGTTILNIAELYLQSQLYGLVSVAVTPASPPMAVGMEQSFTATGKFNNGSVQQLVSVLWSSSAPSVAAVSGDTTNAGAATALAQGTTTIAASAAGIAGSSAVTVTPSALLSIAISPASAMIPVGTTQQFSLTGSYSDGSTQDLTASATWTSSAGAVVAINASGLASGLTQGTASIQAVSGSFTTSTAVSVGPPALVSIAINPASATVASGTTQQYRATGTYSDGSVQDATAVVVWASGTTSVATVSATGMAAGVAQGTSTITASYGSATAVSGSLTVGPPVLTSLTVTPNVASIGNGGSQQLTALGIYSDGSTQNLTTSSTWASSNPAVAAVSGGGLATAAGLGTSTITATSGSIAGSALVVVASGTTQTNLNTSRYQQSATVLDNGQILIAGGVTCPSPGSCTYLNSAEIYDPGSDTFSNTGTMATARSAPALLLNTGKVLVAGGYACDTSGNCASLSSAELYDPNAGTFSAAGTMTQARSGHTMIVLNNGTVLIAGGQTCTAASSCTALSSAEIYDPVAGTFTATVSSLNAARFGAAAVALPSGLVLIAGGFDGTNLPPAAEMYDPTYGLFSGSASLNTPRFGAKATLLNNGTVLVAGGSTCADPGCPTNAAEIYDPVADTFTPVAGGMMVARFHHTATLTPNGQVFIAGGYSSCSSSCTSEATTEVYDPVAGAFTSGQPVASALAGQTGTLLSNGDVLLIGGINAGVTLPGGQWYQPATTTPPGLISIAIAPASTNLIPGQTQQFTATGTFNDGSTQTLQSVIWGSSNPSVAVVGNSPGSAGVVNAQTGGTATLTATAGDVSGSAMLNVIAPVSLTILPAAPTVEAGLSQQLTASGTFPDGSVQNLTAAAAWSSSNSSIVTAGNAPGSQGLATGITAGTASITATIAGVSASTAVTVQPTPQGPPSIANLSPSSGAVGTSVTITGSNFGATQGSSSVAFSGYTATVTNWSSNSITVTVPNGLYWISPGPKYSAQVTVGGASSNAEPFTVMPGIQSLSPSSGPVGTAVTITGTVFGYSGTVTFNGVSAGSVYNWTNSSVTVVVPSGATTGNVVVASGGYVSNPMPFTVVAAPVISGVSPATGLGGTQIAISGSGFGSVQGSGLVWLGSAPGAVVSWSDTQIVATVASNARSGNVQVVQNTIWSNTVPFTVNTAAISSVTPSAGVPGTVVTIAGSGFGAAQGTGQVWLGTANGVVESWSNSQIVAVVANGATSGNAQVLQGGVMSNAVAFTVDALQIASMSPNSGGPGTQVTFTGSGFGATQGNGVVWLGSTAGQVVSWSDTQIVATVAATAVTGIARVEQSDAWSNAFGFWVLPPGSNGVAQITSRLNAVPARYAAAQIERRRSLSPGGNVPSGSAVRPITLRPDQVPGGNAMTLEPSLLNMSVGDTHTIQALSAAGTSVTGLTWTSSNPNVVSLSTDDPPVLTALAAGHVTIIAGAAPNAASADVTVWVGALPLGTVIWSNPGDGSGVSWIVPAVPSTTGVADVFAIQNDGTVQAITSDGTTAWAANISQNQASYYWGPGYVLPDFQGGLVVVGNYDPDTGAASVWKLDGITGQPYPAYTAPGYGADGGGTILCPGAEGWVGGACAAVHPDGTIFAVQENVAVSYDPNLPITRTYSLIGIDPATGAQKFNVPGTSCIPDAECIAFGVMIAGDGYAYLGYEWSEFPNPELLYPFVRHLMVLRVDSSGDYQNIDVSDYTSGGLDFAPLFPYMITNADQGILLTWNNGGKGMATITGGSLSPVSSPLGSQFVPVLQAQDGSFVGITGQDCSVGYGGMVSFDAAGNVRWIVPNDCPQIATADGGVIGQSGITYDQYGNATGMISLGTQSWTGNMYSDGPVDQIFADPYLLAGSFLALAGGEYSPGVAGYPVDSDTDRLVKGVPSKAGILSKNEWAKFKTSNCAAVLGNKDNGLPSMWHNTRYPWDPNMNEVQRAQSELRFYDTGNSYWANMPLIDVLPEPYRQRYNPKLTILNYLGVSAAATLVIPGPGPIPLAPGFFNQKNPQADLIHEVLIHAYAGVSDSQVESDNYFKSQGYWFDGKGSATISLWMSTDCTCTAGNPKPPANIQCKTPNW